MDGVIRARWQIAVFLGLTFVFNGFFYGFLLFADRAAERWTMLHSIAFMWCPGIAALLTRWIMHRTLRGFGWRWGKIRYLLISYAIPLGYCFVVYLSVWFFGWGAFDHARLMRTAARFGLHGFPELLVFTLLIVVAGPLGVLASIISALGEELGWRGFLVPELAQITNFTRLSLISGLIWAVWHYPLIFMLLPRFQDMPARGFALVTFTVMVVGLSFVYAWMRLKSGSVWTSVLLHASHNIYVQAVFDPLTRNTGPTPYIVGEYGAGLTLVGVLIGWVFWRMRKTL